MADPTPGALAQGTPYDRTETRFDFGANWRNFVENSLNEKRVAHAVTSLRDFLRVEDLRGKTFLDIGSGSGLFSLAAHVMGAEHVTSFDYDPDSVTSTNEVKRRFGIPDDRWTVLQGSVIDPAFMASLPDVDVVYSWGVLHATGRMWDAIDAAAAKVRPGGWFAFAVYNKVERFPDSSKMWWHIKRAYTRSPALGRRMMEGVYISHHVATRLITLRNPFPQMFDREGSGRRGMDFLHDVRDWLGGFPHEYATTGEVFEHVRRRTGFHLDRLISWEGNACNEFMFRRPAN